MKSTNFNDKINKTMRLAIAIIFLIVFLMPQIVSAGTIEDKQRELNQINQKIAEQQRILNQKTKERRTLANQVASMDAQIGQTEYSIQKTQTEIDLTQAEIESLINQIREKQKELAYQQSVLNETIRVVYEETSTSFLEMLFSSDDFSQVLDNTEYLGAIEGKISSTMEEINKIKAGLAQDKKDQEDKKTELVDQKNELQGKKTNLAYQSSNKQNLLNQTKGEESRFQAYLNQALQEKSVLSAEIYALRLAQSQSSGESYGSGGSGGYPWVCAPSSFTADPWGFYKCECVSYTAWKWNAVYGKSFYNSIPPAGSAWNWPNLARMQGYSVSSTPRVGGIMVWSIQSGMPYGHVAIVEKVNGNGTVDVSEYNFLYPHGFNYRNGVGAGGHQFIY